MPTEVHLLLDRDGNVVKDQDGSEIILEDALEKLEPSERESMLINLCKKYPIRSDVRNKILSTGTNINKTQKQKQKKFVLCHCHQKEPLNW